jgi:hypothetical protein
MSDIAAVAPSSTNTNQEPTAASGDAKMWSGLSFKGVLKDVLDTINPLQHLPLIGSVYRYLTGDEPSGGARIAGDTLYGGPIGLAVGVVSTMMLDKDGHDLGERALASVFGPSPAGDHDTAVAASPPADPKTATTSATTPPQPLMSGQAPAPAAAAEAAQPRNPAPLATALYRSPPPALTPEQGFALQNAQYQRQFANNRSPSGAPLPNNRPVPLELSSNLLPATPPAALRMPSRPPAPLAATVAPATAAPAQGAAAPNPIAQKMMDALDKYERMKKEEKQGDSAPDAAPAKVDLAL